MRIKAFLFMLAITLWAAPPTFAQDTVPCTESPCGEDEGDGGGGGAGITCVADPAVESSESASLPCFLANSAGGGSKACSRPKFATTTKCYRDSDGALHSSTTRYSYGEWTCGSCVPVYGY